MYLVYTSESGDTGKSTGDPTQPFHVYGALMVHEGQWDPIRTDFRAVCRRYLGNEFGAPDTPSRLNASHILQGKDAFTSWPRSRRSELIDDLLAILIQHETPMLVMYVDKGKFATALKGDDPDNTRWTQPWEPAFARLAYYLDLYMDELNLSAMPQEELIRGAPVHIGERATIISDRPGPGDAAVMQRLLRTEIDLPTGAVHESTYLARPQDSHCTQLADLCTYIFRRHLQRPDQPDPQYTSLEEGHVIQVVQQVQF
jgi:hypothetical protein